MDVFQEYKENQEKKKVSILLNLDKTNDKVAFNEYVNSLKTTYEHFSCMPYYLQSAIAFSKSLKSETRREIICSCIDNNIAIKLLCDPEMLKIMSDVEINACLDECVCNIKHYTPFITNHPNILKSMPSEIANRMINVLLNIFGKFNTNAYPEVFPYLLGLISDEKLAKRISSSTFDEKLLCAIAGNENLSDDLRFNCWYETCSLDVNNFTDKMKEQLIQYYLTSLQINTSKFDILDPIINIVKSPEKYLTPKLESDVLDVCMELEKNNRANATHILRSLGENSKNSNSLYRIHRSCLNDNALTQNVYFNPNFSFEDASDVVTDCIVKFKYIYQLNKPTVSFSGMTDMVSFYGMINICNSRNEDEAKQLYNIIYSELRSHFKYLNVGQQLKLLTLPDFDCKTLNGLPNFHSPIILSLVYANKQLSKSNLSFEYKRMFLKQLAHLLDAHISFDCMVTAGLAFEDNFNCEELITKLDKDYSKTGLGFYFKDNKMPLENISSKDYNLLMKISKKINSYLKNYSFGSHEKSIAIISFLGSIKDDYAAQKDDYKTVSKLSSKILTRIIFKYLEELNSFTNDVDKFLFEEKEREYIKKVATELEERGDRVIFDKLRTNEEASLLVYQLTHDRSYLDNEQTR